VSTIGELTVCPFCKEEIAAGAIKCKHCHSNLAPMADEVEGANFSDAHVVEYNEPGVALGVIIVWSLYLFSFFLGVIPTGINQNLCAHFRRPMDMIFQG